MFSRQDRKNARVYFTHFQVKVDGSTRDGHATVAIVKYDNKVLYGMAFCSPNDQFCRKQGRHMAMKRLYSDYGVMSGVEGNPYNVCEEVIKSKIYDYLDCTPVPWLEKSDKIFLAPRCRRRVKSNYPERVLVVER